MVIEHVFVTTMDASSTMQLAAAYLVERGFAQGRQDAFPVGATEWTVIELNRGKKNAARAKNVRDLPQIARVEWDRGRVVVALSIGFNAAWGGGGFGTVSEKSAKMQLHTRLLNAIAKGLQQLLAHDGTGHPDYSQWDAAEAEIMTAARKRRNRALIVLFVIFAIIAGLILLVVVAAK